MLTKRTFMFPYRYCKVFTGKHWLSTLNEADALSLSGHVGQWEETLALKTAYLLQIFDSIKKFRHHNAPSKGYRSPYNLRIKESITRRSLNFAFKFLMDGDDDE